MMRYALCVLAGGVCLTFAACDQPGQASKAKPPEAAAAEAKSVPAENAAAPAGDAPKAAGEVALEVKSWSDIQAWVAKQQGKVVVVDVWSTSCVPCVAEFPNLVKLHSRFPEKLVCVSANVDYYGKKKAPPQSLQDKVLKFLTEQNSTLKNYVCSDSDEEVVQAISVAAIPAVLVYGADGKLSKKFVNDDGEYGKEGFTYQDHIVPHVEKLLAE